MQLSAVKCNMVNIIDFKNSLCTLDPSASDFEGHYLPLHAAEPVPKCPGWGVLWIHGSEVCGLGWSRTWGGVPGWEGGAELFLGERRAWDTSSRQ